MNKILTVALALVIGLTSCNDDNDSASAAKSGTFEVTIKNTTTNLPYFKSDVAAVPVGKTEGGPIFPGDAYEFTFEAGQHVIPNDEGTRLSFATMFVQSNDLFVAPNPGGIALYDDNGSPISGDITNQVFLWDAGTEVNDTTGSDSQKPQQDPAAADIGTDENGVVALIENNFDGTNNLPALNEVVRVTITNENETQFTVRFENISTSTSIETPAKGAGTTAAVPFSPIVWAVHTNQKTFFETGEPASEGIEDIAEDGFFDVKLDALKSKTGLLVPLSPGSWAVHNSDATPLFQLGAADAGLGLEGIAEDGTPDALTANLADNPNVSEAGSFSIPEGQSAPAAIGPGGSYTFSFQAEDGDYLSLATMFVQSNDWFYSFGENGWPLFKNSTAQVGEFNTKIKLYDAGTEVDQFPGAGADQVIRQSSPNSGANDADNTVRLVDEAAWKVQTAVEGISIKVEFTE